MEKRKWVGFLVGHCVISVRCQKRLSIIIFFCLVGAFCRRWWFLSGERINQVDVPGVVKKTAGIEHNVQIWAYKIDTSNILYLKAW
jgi:hypothetical protein